MNPAKPPNTTTTVMIASAALPVYNNHNRHRYSVFHQTWITGSLLFPSRWTVRRLPSLLEIWYGTAWKPVRYLTITVIIKKHAFKFGLHCRHHHYHQFITNSDNVVAVTLPSLINAINDNSILPLAETRDIRCMRFSTAETQTSRARLVALPFDDAISFLCKLCVTWSMQTAVRYNAHHLK